jgi:transposase InsO family protein
MNSAAGRCHDNAKCESMWARGKEEIMALYDTKKMTCEQLKGLIFRYYMSYWNNRRICSAIGGVPPAIKRGAYYEKLADCAA